MIKSSVKNPISPVNTDEANEFLDRLRDEWICWQTFDDNKERASKYEAAHKGHFNRARTYVTYAPLGHIIDRLTATNRSGSGIYTCVNYTDRDAKRREENVKRIRSHYIDHDAKNGHLDLDAIKSWVLKPRFVIETSPLKYHIHWNVDTDVEGDLAGWSYRQAQLAKRWDADPSMTKLPGVLRVPGFWHMKNPDKPFQVRIVYRDEQAPYYNVAEFEAALADIEVDRPKQAKPRKSRSRWNEPTTDELREDGEADPELVANVIAYLKSDLAPIAREGVTGPDGVRKPGEGDNTTYDVACEVRDQGRERAGVRHVISMQCCFRLMWEHYNVEGKCVPLWSRAGLWAKVKNAYRYAENDPGSKAQTLPEDDFAEDLIGDESAGRGGEDPDAVPGAAGTVGQRQRAGINDMWLHSPTNTYIFAPTGDYWSAQTVPKRFGTPACEWVDRHHAVEQATWFPGMEQIIKGKLMVKGAFAEARPGYRSFNLYRPPVIDERGNANEAQPWLDHIASLWPDDWERLRFWFAWRVQHPDVKINHALVLGGPPRDGKDSSIAPLREAVGPWNFAEATPADLFDTFNAPFLQSVVCRINEAKDMGDGRTNRWDLYERSKI
jgi:hypothetical protein